MSSTGTHRRPTPSWWWRTWAIVCAALAVAALTGSALLIWDSLRPWLTGQVSP